jgi:hypothetical protein
MAILNPRFQDAGAALGAAANWTLQTVVAGQRAAGFGPDPVRAVEAFERWCAFAPAFDPAACVLAFFTPAYHGVEDFRGGWANDTFQVELSGGDAEACPFSGGLQESFEIEWNNAPPITDWSGVAAQPGLFEGAELETFEVSWSSNESAVTTWKLLASAQAAFSGIASGAETFETTWPKATTL